MRVWIPWSSWSSVVSYIYLYLKKKRCLVLTTKLRKSVIKSWHSLKGAGTVRSTIGGKETLYKDKVKGWAKGHEWVDESHNYPRQHVHNLHFGFCKKRIMSGMCFHERPISVFCIKFKKKKNTFSEHIISKTVKRNKNSRSSSEKTVPPFVALPFQILF